MGPSALVDASRPHAHRAGWSANPATLTLDPGSGFTDLLGESVSRNANGSVRAIADELDVVEATVNRAWQEHGIAIRDASSTQRLRMPAELYDAEWLRQQYATKSGAQIADELGVSKPVIHKAMGRVGIDTDGARGCDVIRHA